ncbi:unnamed protein product [Rotaria sp. Silwood2]|nr:unnamed protein product [Rotaria sp. Silwood2]
MSQQSSKQCNLCGQIFCSKCIQKTTNFIQLNSLRSCTTCLLITNERTTYDQLASIRIKYLRAYLIHSKTVSLNRVETCFEKQDLINLILSAKNQIPEENYVFVERPTTINIQTSNDNTTTINIDNNQPIQQSTINTDEHNNYIKQYNLGGAFFWELSSDRQAELIDATFNALNNGIQPPPVITSAASSL